MDMDRLNLPESIVALIRGITHGDIALAAKELPTEPETGMRFLGDCPGKVVRLVALDSKFARQGLTHSSSSEIEVVARTALCMQFGLNPGGGEFQFVYAAGRWSVYYAKRRPTVGLKVFREVLLARTQV